MSADPTRPLPNVRREAFCQHYAGDCWGNAAEAYRRAGYAAKGAETAGPRLYRAVEVKARIAQLRTEACGDLGVDRYWILRRRREIAETALLPADRLRALDQLERALGLSVPERVQVEHSGATEHVHRVEVAPDSMASLRQYVEEIVQAVLPTPAVAASSITAASPDGAPS